MKYTISWIIIYLSLGSYKGNYLTAPCEQFKVTLWGRGEAIELYNMELRNKGARSTYYIDSIKIDSTR